MWRDLFFENICDTSGTDFSQLSGFCVGNAGIIDGAGDADLLCRQSLDMNIVPALMCLARHGKIMAPFMVPLK